jgi:hypothetical protein
MIPAHPLRPVALLLLTPLESTRSGADLGSPPERAVEDSDPVGEILPTLDSRLSTLDSQLSTVDCLTPSLFPSLFTLFPTRVKHISLPLNHFRTLF